MKNSSGDDGDSRQSETAEAFLLTFIYPLSFPFQRLPRKLEKLYNYNLCKEVKWEARVRLKW